MDSSWKMQFGVFEAQGMSLVGANVILFLLNKIWQVLSYCWDGCTIVCCYASWIDANCCDACRDFFRSECRYRPTDSVTDIGGSKLHVDTSCCTTARRRHTRPVIWQGQMCTTAHGDRCRWCLVMIETLLVPPAIQQRGSQCSLFVK